MPRHGGGRRQRDEDGLLLRRAPDTLAHAVAREGREPGGNGRQIENRLALPNAPMNQEATSGPNVAPIDQASSSPLEAATMR